MAIQVPSFWDYLAGGLDRGISAFQNERQRRRDEAVQNFNMIQQLFNAGVVDASDVQPAAQKIGINVPIAPNAAELRRRIMSGQLENPTDEQARFAGTMTSTERAQDENIRNVALIRSRFMRGEEITPQEAEIAGLTSPEERQARRLESLQPIMEAAGKRYVSQILLRSGGRIDPNKLAEIADAAFNDFASDREMQMLNLTPDQLPYARAYFAQALMDAYAAQQYADLQKELRQITAGTRQGQNLLDSLTRMANAADARLRAIENGPMGTIITYYASRPDADIPESFVQRVNEYRIAQQVSASLRQLNTMYAAGHISSEQLVEYISAAEQQLAEISGVSTSTGGQFPVGTVPPAVGGRPARTPPRDMSPAELDRARRQLKAMRSSDRQMILRQKFENGQINAADARRLGYDPDRDR